MNCENCGADVPKLYVGSDGRKYCCPGCLFHPLGCRCKFGEFGMVQEGYQYEEDYDADEEDFIDDDELGRNDPSQCDECLENLDFNGNCPVCDF